MYRTIRSIYIYVASGSRADTFADILAYALFYRVGRRSLSSENVELLVYLRDVWGVYTQLLTHATIEGSQGIPVFGETVSKRLWLP